MSKFIEIVIDPKGETKLQTKGFSGTGCQDASRLLEQAIGQIQSDVRTAEFYQPDHVHTEQQQQS